MAIVYWRHLNVEKTTLFWSCILLNDYGRQNWIYIVLNLIFSYAILFAHICTFVQAFAKSDIILNLWTLFDPYFAFNELLTRFFGAHQVVDYLLLISSKILQRASLAWLWSSMRTSFELWGFLAPIVVLL